MENETPSLEEAKAVAAELKRQIEQIILGQDRPIDMTLVALLCGGHALIEGAPGVAKTLLVNTLAACLEGKASRVQFTPDLMPTDITGTNVFNFQENAFTLIKGPVFTSFLLADEINRAPAKTQAALLQAMQERRVTIDGENHELGIGFTVFATQNPIDFEGTYPLPEAQKDRFLLQIDMDYPSAEEELALAKQFVSGATPESRLAAGAVKPVCSLERFHGLLPALAQMEVKEELVAYMVDVVRRTRESEATLLGGGPRATISLFQASRAWALLQERDYVTPDDVKLVAPYVLKHRILLRPEFELEGLTPSELLDQVFESAPVPR